MHRSLRGAAYGIAKLALAALSLSLVGCGTFFINENGSTGGDGGAPVTNTGDFAYVATGTQGATYIAGYQLGSGTLTPMSTPTVNLTYDPSAMAIAPSNGFLYVSSSAGGIYAYSISSSGVLSILNGGNSVATSARAVAMDFSADGNFFFIIDTSSGIPTLIEYSVNTSTGLLVNSVANFTLLNLITPGQIVECDALAPCGIKVAPSGSYVAVATGNAGDEIFLLSGEIFTSSYIPLTHAAGDFAVTMDSNNYTYFAETGGVVVYSLSGGNATEVAGKAFPTAGGLPRGITLSNKTGTYVYGANNTNSTIYGFSNSSTGALTALPTPTVSGPTNVYAVAVDNSGKYLIALGYSTDGLMMYSIGSTGVLTKIGSPVATGNTQPALLVVSH